MKSSSKPRSKPSSESFSKAGAKSSSKSGPKSGSKSRSKSERGGKGVHKENVDIPIVDPWAWLTGVYLVSWMQFSEACCLADERLFWGYSGEI